MIAVLRLGHRPERDKRITTHLCLVARAFGAERVLLTTRDKAVVRSVRDVTERFGGSFEIEDGVSWKQAVQEWKGRVVHLTMYGESLPDALPRIPRDNLLIAVGAEKVPGELYGMADFNVSVGNQPHSEVAALAVLLYALDPGSLTRAFAGKLRVVPSARGKRVVRGS